MNSLPSSPEDVKHILTALDPHTGNYAAFLLTDDRFINIPVVADTIDLFSLLYRLGEINHPDAFIHETGFLAFFRDETTLYLPHKDLPRFPFPRSQPATFEVGIVDFGQPVQFYGLGETDTLITLERPAQRGEISKRDISHVRTVARTRERDKKSDYDPIGQPETTDSKKRHLHVVPPTSGVAQVPEPEKPTPTVDSRSVGLTRKFAYIPGKLMELMEADRLSMRDIEVYRIIYTFRKYPEKPRIREEGKGPAYPLPYSITYQSQIIDYLKIRKTDLMATARVERRNQARKMGISLRSVKRAIHRLCEAGYLARVYPGRPKDCPWLTPGQQERRIERHERVPQWGPQKYILATDKRQRGLLKVLDRNLKKAGKPPFLIYLPGPRT